MSYSVSGLTNHSIFHYMVVTKETDCFADSVEVASQAASLAKADLATSVVTEMTDLAGIIGRHYALKQGVDAAVADVRLLSIDFSG